MAMRLPTLTVNSLLKSITEPQIMDGPDSRSSPDAGWLRQWWMVA